MCEKNALAKLKRLTTASILNAKCHFLFIQMHASLLRMLWFFRAGFSALFSNSREEMTVTICQFWECLFIVAFFLSWQLQEALSVTQSRTTWSAWRWVSSLLFPLMASTEAESEKEAQHRKCAKCPPATNPTCYFVWEMAVNTFFLQTSWPTGGSQ